MVVYEKKLDHGQWESGVLESCGGAVKRPNDREIGSHDTVKVDTDSEVSSIPGLPRRCSPAQC